MLQELKFMFCVCILVNAQLLYSSENNIELVIPIDFNKERIPVINIDIDNKTYVFQIDLGMGNAISIRKEILKKLTEIKFTGNEKKFSDLSGAKYKVREYIIPKISINDYDYRNIIGVEYVDWGTHLESDEKGNGHSDTEKFDGVIGRDLLNKHNLIIDYKAKQFIVIFNQKSNYAQKFNKNKNIPFQIDKDGIKIKLLVNGKNSIFVLDTGASMSIISNEYAKINGGSILPCSTIFNFEMDCNVLQANSLMTSDKKLLPMNFMIHDFKGLSTDGILGYDFFISNKIMLLFDENVIKFASSS